MEDHDRLVAQIYEAVLHPELWSRLGMEIADFLGAGTVHMMLASPSEGIEYLSLFPRGDETFASEYLRDYIDLDFRVPRVLANKPGLPIDERSYVSREEARKSPIHQEFLPKYQIYDIVGANLTIGDSLGWFGVSTLRPGDDLDRDRQRVFAKLAPHILNAYTTMKVNHDQRIRSHLADAALDLVDAGILLVRGNKLVKANRAGIAILSDGFFTVVNGKLVCSDPLENTRLARCQDNFVPGTVQQTTIYNLKAEREFRIRFHANMLEPGGSGLLKIKEMIFTIIESDTAEETDPAAVEAFCAGSGVTPAELAVLGVVLSDGNLSRLAVTRGVSLDTVQKQRKSAMAKLGVSSQRELIRAFTRFQFLA